jgi:hypothetical protein
MKHVLYFASCAALALSLNAWGQTPHQKAAEPVPAGEQPACDPSGQLQYNQQYGAPWFRPLYGGSRASTLTEPQIQNLMSEARVEGNLAQSRILAGSTVSVAVENGVATLNGKVPNETARQRAATIASRTRGISKVVNNLMIDPNLEAAANLVVPDAELSKRVAEQLAQKLYGKAVADKTGPGWTVESICWGLAVDSDGGTIFLSGDVSCYDAMRRAIAVTRSIPGVKAVENRMALSIQAEPATAE